MSDRIQPRLITCAAFFNQVEDCALEKMYNELTECRVTDQLYNKLIVGRR